MAVGASPRSCSKRREADYTAGQYDLAILGFEPYIKSFPKSDSADDAQVRIGNSYLADGKNDKAVEAYDLAIRNYPTGDTIPEALLPQGDGAQHAERQPSGARGAWDEVVKNYPDSDAAQLARQGLERLKRPDR